MPFVPDWAPNVHPMIVHFPIALLFVGVLIDLIGLAFRERAFWRGAALIFYVGGGLGALAAVLSGNAAADSVFLPSDANALLTEHSDLGTYTLWLFGAYGIARIAAYFTKLDMRMPIRLGLTVVAAGGLILVWQTAEHGSEMVYRYGVGVQAVDASPTVVLPATDSTATSGPVMEEAGGWSWKPTRAAAWKSDVTISPDGSPGLVPSLRDGGERGREASTGREPEPREVAGDGDRARHDELSESAEELARRTQGRLESDFRSLYELGERTGERMIDFGFDVLDPRRFIERAAGVVHRVAGSGEGRDHEPKEDDGRTKAEA